VKIRAPTEDELWIANGQYQLSSRRRSRGKVLGARMTYDLGTWLVSLDAAAAAAAGGGGGLITVSSKERGGRQHA